MQRRYNYVAGQSIAVNSCSRVQTLNGRISEYIYTLCASSWALALASFPGLLAPAFVACSTNAGEGLVKLSHVV